jgi:hypothetical protein
MTARGDCRGLRTWSKHSAYWVNSVYKAPAWESDLWSISFEVMLPSACNFIVDGLTFSCRCSTLHVSAYIAIFRCVWCFSFIFLKESASLLLLPFLARGYTMRVLICVFLCVFSLVSWFLCACLPSCLSLLSVGFSLMLIILSCTMLLYWIIVIRLYTTRIKCIITLLWLHVSALLGHHQVTNVYNF